jgi:5'-nucleotidase
VRGTPTDSVIMGARHLLKNQRPDLVLSGINRGANMAEDVTYSCTIAGALEGTQLGIRSIALSQAYSYGAGDFPHWETPIAHAPKLIRRLLAQDWPPLVLMNINFPDRTPDAIEGVMVTSQGRRDQQNLIVDERRDTWGNPYYWLGYTIRRSNPDKGTDIWAVYNGWISVTPLSMNLTERSVQAQLAKRLAE